MLPRAGARAEMRVAPRRVGVHGEGSGCVGVSSRPPRPVQRELRSAGCGHVERGGRGSGGRWEILRG